MARIVHPLRTQRKQHMAEPTRGGEFAGVLVPRAEAYIRLTLVHFSAQLEPCLMHKNSLHTLKHPLLTPA